MFPKPIQFSEDFFVHIQQAFPMLAFKKIQCREHLPWFVLRKFARALAIPNIYSQNTSIIYVANDILPKKEFERIVVHELAHIFQYQIIGNKGFGIFRSGFIMYVHLFYKHGYQNHPMEISARTVEESWLSYSKKQDIQAFHKTLEQEKLHMLALKQKYFQWSNIAFWFSLLSTFVLQALLFLLSLPGYLIFLIGLIRVFQKRSNSQRANASRNRGNG